MLQALKHSIELCERRYNRTPRSVILLAASKGQPIDSLKHVLEEGQIRFGENYLQEALPKIEALRIFSPEWHFIGPIQRNKTRKIAEHFDWVQSVDSFLIAKRLNDQRPPSLPPLNICLEVNLNNEPTKSGISIEALEPLAKACLALPHLLLRGLMTIPAPKETFEAQKKEFSKLKTIYDEMVKKGYLFDTLSMGMSHDMEAAIAAGSTMVRIGTALFGARA